MEHAKQYDITLKDIFTGNEEPLIEFFSGLDVKVENPLDIEFDRLETVVVAILMKPSNATA